MSRPHSPLPTENIKPALAYLSRVAERGQPLAFLLEPDAVRMALSALGATLESSEPVDRPAVFHAWSAQYLTPGGRVRMLNALRRRRADAKIAAAADHTVLRLPAKTVRRLKSISRQAGISLAQLLSAFAAQVQADASIVEQLRQVVRGETRENGDTDETDN